MTVDTLSLSKELRAAELSPTQADAIAAAIGRAVVEGTATKADLLLTKNELKADVVLTRNEVKAEIQQLKSEVETKIEQLRTTMMSWSIATILSVAAVVIAVVKL